MNKQGSFKYFYLDVIQVFILRKQNYSSSKYSGVISSPSLFPCVLILHTEDNNGCLSLV